MLPPSDKKLLALFLTAAVGFAPAADAADCPTEVPAHGAPCRVPRRFRGRRMQRVPELQRYTGCVFAAEVCVCEFDSTLWNCETKHQEEYAPGLGHQQGAE